MARRSASAVCGRGSVISADAQKKSQRAAEQDRPDIAEARQQWRARQAEWRPHNLVFVDETGASTKMTRLYGRCPRGERLVAPVPWGHLEDDHLRRRAAAGRSHRTLRVRRADQRRDVPRLGRAVPRSRLAPGRYRHPGQSVEPQGRGRQDGDRKRWRPSALPAFLQPRPQPDRAVVRASPQGRGATFAALIHAIASALETFTPDCPDECANYLELRISTQ